MGSRRAVIETLVSRALFSSALTLTLVIVIMNELYYRGVLAVFPESLSNYLNTHSDFDSSGFGDHFVEELDLSSFLSSSLLLVGIGGQ